MAKHKITERIGGDLVTSSSHLEEATSGSWAAAATIFFRGRWETIMSLVRAVTIA